MTDVWMLLAGGVIGCGSVLAGVFAGSWLYRQHRGDRP